MVLLFGMKILELFLVNFGGVETVEFIGKLLKWLFRWDKLCFRLLLSKFVLKSQAHSSSI